MTSTAYETVIGLEVHVQLKTRSKLFSRVSTQFGAPPNTQTSPICLGLPGTLPVMNRKAFELALVTAVALNCEIPRMTKWDRKQYYYPDLPKGYQISQYDLPMSRDGYLEISDPKGQFAGTRVGIIRAHLEEDAGKSMHDEGRAEADSRIDLNRTGTPLLEIVTRPDMRSPAQAKTFLTELKLLLGYLAVSDCNMQEGSLRVDANINLHLDIDGAVVATPIVEVKNMNSFRAVERALAYEADRQYQAWQETGQRIGDVPKQTRGWDDQAQRTYPMRQKEESSDYRYLPDPDLVPVVVEPGEVRRVRQGLGELPAAIRVRLQQQYGISTYDADVIVNQGRGLVEYFEGVFGEPLKLDRLEFGKRVSNWIQQDVMRALNENSLTVADFPVPPGRLADLLDRITHGKLDNARARDVFQEMLLHRRSVADAMQSLGIEQVDSSQLEDLCRQLLADNPKIVADVKGGNAKAVGALIGQAKQRNPNANPVEVRRICLELIDKM